MRCKFPQRDLSQRLHGTICRYKGEPYYVSINGGNVVLLTLNNLEKIVATISPDDPAFDIASPPLGYTNLAGTVYYVIRKPLRKYKQGIDHQSLSYETLRKDVRKEHGAQTIVYSKGFEDMIRGSYPSLTQGLTILRKEVLKREYFEIAISRDIALSISKHGVINVYYKNELVGWIKPDDNVVQVSNNGMGWVVSRYLKELSWEVN